ncbi:MAG: hypothetical protein K9L78_01755 [Victivallales bacterium]|nr:hypothetical protein [Victivallales bacterium]
MKKLFIITSIIFYLLCTTAVFGTEAWDSGKVYSKSGIQVEYQGSIYKNKWWTQGENPVKSGQWGVWELIEENVDPMPDPAPNPTPSPSGNTWKDDTVYNDGDLVVYNGKKYEAQWWTKGDNPEQTGQWGAWKVLDETVTPQPDPEPTPEPSGDTWNVDTVYNDGARIVYNGKKYEAQWWTKGDNPELSGKWGVWRLVDENIDPPPEPDPTPDPDPNPDPVPAPDPVPDPININKKVGAYFAEWGIYGRDYQVTDIPVKHITHITYAFLNIKNGKAVIGDPYAAVDKHFKEVTTEYGTFPADSWNKSYEYCGNFRRLNLLDEMVQDYYGKDIVILLSVGGWTWSENFPEVIKDGTSREVFAQSLVDIVEQYNFDGVSLDYEYIAVGPQKSYSIPKPEESDQFILLLKKLREKFEALENKTGKKYEITMAVSGAPGMLKYVDVKGMSDYCDVLDIMTYDYSAPAWGNAAGHQSAVYNNPKNPDNQTNSDFENWNVNGITQYLIEQGVPRSKILIGAPLYGRSGKNITELFQTGGTIGDGSWGKGVYDYHDIINMSSEYVFYDENAEASYYLNTTTQEFITFDNIQAVQAKCRYIRAQDLSGIFFWEFSGDSPDPEDSIIKAVHDYFTKAL